jgi:translation initiation factor IF-1
VGLLSRSCIAPFFSGLKQDLYAICSVNEGAIVGWAIDAIAALQTGDTVRVQPFGGSMRGRVESGELVTLAPARGTVISRDEIVFVRWRGNFLLHKVIEISKDQVLIGNNLGKTNGYIALDDVIGVMTHVCDEPTCEGQIKRHLNNLSWMVALDDGREVQAHLSKSRARGMFRVCDGDRDVIGGLWNSDYKILSFADATPNNPMHPSGGSAAS